MRGIDSGTLSPETGSRVKRYSFYNAAELVDVALSATTIRMPPVSLVGIVPNTPANAIRRGRVIRCGFQGETAADATGEINAEFYKMIAAGNGLPAGCVGKGVALQHTTVPSVASLAAYTRHELTEAQMAPDERGHSDHRGVSGAATGAGTSSTLAAAANANYAEYYVGSLLRRLDTGEGQIITAYNQGTKVATHATWTLGTVIMPAATPYIIKHDNRIVRPNDTFKVALTNDGAGTQPTLVWFYVDVLELATYTANNFA